MKRPDDICLCGHKRQYHGTITSHNYTQGRCNSVKPMCDCQHFLMGGTMTWTCHICKEKRPDDKISVLSKVTVLSGDVPATENIRYCNDKADCAERAKTFSHFATKK